MSGSQLLGQYLAKIVQPETLAVFGFCLLLRGMRDDDVWTGTPH